MPSSRVARETALYLVYPTKYSLLVSTVQMMIDGVFVRLMRGEVCKGIRRGIVWRSLVSLAV